MSRPYRHRPRLATIAMAGAVLAIGCGQDQSGKKPQASATTATGSQPGAADGMVGVDPSIFQCDSITPVNELAKAVAGGVQATEPMFTAPKGTPLPCSYALLEPRPLPVPDGGLQAEETFMDFGDATPPAPAQWLWSITYDCREQYAAATEREMNRLVAEEGARKIELGKWGIEHKDASVQFWDGDSPCWVRVVGPGGPERMAIARLIESRLTADNAPMRPRRRAELQ